MPGPRGAAGPIRRRHYWIDRRPETMKTCRQTQTAAAYGGDVLRKPSFPKSIPTPKPGRGPREFVHLAIGFPPLCPQKGEKNGTRNRYKIKRSETEGFTPGVQS
jgi:hypothetical protein